MTKKLKSPPGGYSKSFFDLVRAIGESKSKQEEDTIIVKEISHLKQHISSANVEQKKMKEYLIRLIYCEMLGHTAEFGYIHAVKLMPSTNLLEKRIGYLAVALCIRPEDELNMLVIAQMQKDLASTNSLEVCAGLHGTRSLHAEMIPCVLPAVKGLLGHSSALVKKKAMMAMTGFYKLDETSVGEDLKPYRTALCDKDPCVMGASLHLFYEMALIDPVEHQNLIPTFVDILKQITEHRLSREYDYHRVPAPWIQIKLLKLLSLLCTGDKSLSTQCTEVLVETLKRADTGLNIGYAVMYECIKTITSIPPEPSLIEAAADAISKFVTSPSPNLKYLGVTSLKAIVRIDPKHAMNHQAVVMDCLEDPDETIKRKTLDLLFSMTTEKNVEVISARLIRFLSNTTDSYLKDDLANKITDLALRFSKSPSWYVHTLNSVIELAPKCVKEHSVQGLLKLVAEGSGEDEDDDEAFRLECVEKYYSMLVSQETYSDTMYRIIAWVIGEYGFLAKNQTSKDLIDALCDMIDRTCENVETKGWVLTALMKLSSQSAQPRVKDQMKEVIEKFQAHQCTDLQQRAQEFKVLLEHPETFMQCLPVDGCCEDIDVDKDLSFLNGLVQDCLNNGYKPYQKKDDFVVQEKAAIRVEAYEAPAELRKPAPEEDAHVIESSANDEIKLEVKERKWGKKVEEKEEEHVPAAPVTDVVYEESHHDTGGLDDSSSAKKKKKETAKEKEMKALFGDGEEKKKLTKEEKAAKKAEKEAKKKAKEEKKVAKALGAMSLSTSHDPASPQQPSPTSPGLDDLLGGGGAQAPAAAGGGGVDIEQLFGESQPAPASQPASPANSAPRTNLGTDGILAAEYQKEYLDNGQLAVQLIFTVTQGAASNVTFAVQPATAGTTVALDSPTGQVQSASMVVFASLAPNSVAAVVRCVMTFATLAFSPQLTGQVSYLDPTGASRGFQVGIPITVTDLLRPQGAANTQEFGAMWAQHTCEAKFVLQKNITTAELSSIMESKCNVKTVEVIGQETIMVATIANQALILTHCIMGANGTLNFTIRSKDQSLTNAMGQQVQIALQ